MKASISNSNGHPILGARYRRGAPPVTQLGADAQRELAEVLAKFEDQTYVFEERQCAVCSGSRFDVLAEQDRYTMPIKTTICRSCGLIQTNPDMRESDYTDFYTHHYRRLYIADLVGQPEDFFREEYWRGRKILGFVRRHLAVPKGRLVVEIGCGAGGILQAFADAGYRVIGTDLGAENLAYGKSHGLDLRNGDLFGLADSLDEKPALVVYSHVLEHIREPGKSLEKVRELLASDGHLYVEVPGVKDVRRNVFQGDFLKTFHLAHIYNFSLLTLQNLARKHGYEPIAGDETVRALFRPAHTGATSGFPVSDYVASVAYMEATERRREFYRRRFAARMAMRAVTDGIRARAITLLHRLGLYRHLRRRIYDS